MLAYGVMTALFTRERTGPPGRSTSHLGSMSWLQGLGLSARLMLGRAPTPRKYATNPLWNHYRCADGDGSRSR
jgi:crotonobetainyl-CoA:carnitine CoA-transferase CaiB-like acyl-CoA transferase